MDMFKGFPWMMVMMVIIGWCLGYFVCAPAVP